MLGGLQFRALQRELVESGKMTDRDFHDAILKENRIPIEMVRACSPSRSSRVITGRAGGSTTRPRVDSDGHAPEVDLNDDTGLDSEFRAASACSTRR